MTQFGILECEPGNACTNGKRKKKPINTCEGIDGLWSLENRLCARWCRLVSRSFINSHQFRTYLMQTRMQPSVDGGSIPASSTIQSNATQRKPRCVAFFFAIRLPGIAPEITPKSHQIHTRSDQLGAPAVARGFW